jgi:hypothetical protein
MAVFLCFMSILARRQQVRPTVDPSIISFHSFKFSSTGCSLRGDGVPLILHSLMASTGVSSMYLMRY